MARRYDRDPLAELKRLLKGRSLEDILKAPDAYMTVGEIASLGAAYEYLGDILIRKAREQALPRVRDEKSFTDDRIRFDLWGGYELQRINFDLIKKRFPPESHGEFYRTDFREEVAAIHVLSRNERE